jgi:tryptophan synthase alpha chain
VAGGGRIFIPYVTGGLPGVDASLLRGFQDAGADAIEVGIPFSDPVMDGPVIQVASQRALDGGADLAGILDTIAGANLEVPVVLMTYLNPILACGMDRFVDLAIANGVAGVVVPDLPVDESAEWRAACPPELATVFLAAPGTSKERLGDVARRSRGFVYCVSTYGVTGEREGVSETARVLVDALRSFTSTPLVVGVGIGTPEAASAACEFADGVVVGTALVRPMLDADPPAALALAKKFRDAVA